MLSIAKNNSSNNFNDFKILFPDWEKRFGIYKTDSNDFKRIRCIWKDNEIQHEYWATLNTKNGDVYLDCAKSVIWVKMAITVVPRILHTFIKTAYHLSIILPFAIEMRKIIKDVKAWESSDSPKITKKQLYKKCFFQMAKTMWQSTQDIVRTPLYGLAMTCLHVAALPAAIITPNSIYTFRKIIGDLERKSLRCGHHNPQKSPWGLTACFSPYFNLVKNASLSEQEKFAEKGIHLTPFLKEEVKESWEELIKARISFQAEKEVTYRKNMGKLPPGKAYMSFI